MAKVQDEAGHGLYLYCATETLGADRKDMIEELKWNEEKGSYDIGEIDWDEFYSVVNGKGPCNQERLKARTDADNNGQWVREAAEAYAAKRAS